MGLCAELLELGGPIRLAGRAAFGMAALYAIGQLKGHPLVSGEVVPPMVLWLSFITWTALEWLGSRVILDRKLFLLFANGTYSVSDLDRLLLKPGRDTLERTQGALALLRRMSVLAGTLCVLLLVLLIAL
jgi:hypothetical protein